MQFEKILISALLLFSLQFAHAQEEGKSDDEILRPRHEINIGFTNIFSPYRYYNSPVISQYEYLAIDQINVSNDLLYPIYPYIPPMMETYFGVGYKYHFGRYAARIRMGFRYSNEENKETPYDNYLSESEYTNNTYRIRTGIERTMLRLEKFDFYLALDGIYASAEQVSKSYSAVNNDTYSSENKTTYTEVGAGLNLGIRYFIHKNISFAIESKIDYTRTDVETTYKYDNTGSNPSNSVNTNSNELTEISLSPVSLLSFNVHF